MASVKDRRVCPNSILSWELTLTDRVAKVASISQAADALITTETNHCFEVSDSVQLVDVDSCPNRDGYYTVATVPTPMSFTAGLDSQQHGQDSAQGYAIRESDLSLRSFWGEIYATGTINQKLIQDVTISGIIGEKVLTLSSPVKRSNIFLPGDLISIPDLGITDAQIESASGWTVMDFGDPQSTQVILIDQSVSTAGSGIQDWSASRTRDDDEFTVLAGIIGAGTNRNKVTFTAPSLNRGTYKYKVGELIAGERELLQEGTIVYE